MSLKDGIQLYKNYSIRYVEMIRLSFEDLQELLPNKPAYGIYQNMGAWKPACLPYLRVLPSMPSLTVELVALTDASHAKEG